MGEHVFYGGKREALGEEERHGIIVHGEDSDVQVAVDLIGKVGEGEIMVEGGKQGVFGKYCCDVVCITDRG